MSARTQDPVNCELFGCRDAQVRDTMMRTYAWTHGDAVRLPRRHPARVNNEAQAARRKSDPKARLGAMCHPETSSSTFRVTRTDCSKQE